MNSIPVCTQLQKGSVVCPHCRTAVRIGPDLCLMCMLSQGIGASGKSSETLDDLLSQIDGSDADWRLGHRQILEGIERAKDLGKNR